MQVETTQQRVTKYVAAVREHLRQMGHATNTDLLVRLRKQFPDVSATTVHRVTTRMIERGELQFAPSGKAGAMRLDFNLEPHDHFMCEKCGLLRDAHLGEIIRPQIEKAIGLDCSISGNLTVSGICKECHKEDS